MESTNHNNEQTSIATHPTNRCTRLNVSEWVKLLSNLTIPLIIGVFTIFIAIHQQNLAQANRDNDIAEAAKLREEDLEREQARREEDKELAYRKREDDKEAAYIKREEDKETARLQRELDQKIAEDKRIQEYELVDQQSNLYQNQRAHEFEIVYKNRIANQILADDRRKEKILMNYQRDLAKLLLEYDSILNVSRVMLLTILKIKTRTALRLLNPERRTIIVRTLHQVDFFGEAWEKEKSLLYQVNISGAQFGQPSGSSFSTFLTKYYRLSIEHADARYATFRSISLTWLSSFAHINFDFTDWSFARLYIVSFYEKITMNDALFANTDFQYVKFGNISMNRVSFQYNIRCDECIFNGTSLSAAHLDHSNFSHSQFISSSMADVSITNSYFYDTTFKNVILDRVDFSKSILVACTFIQVSMINCSMIGTKLQNTKFSDVNRYGCKISEDN